MEILINKNNTGYFWCEGELDISSLQPKSGKNEDYELLTRGVSKQKSPELLQRLATSDQYDWAFFKTHSTYCLALNNVKDDRRDQFGRPLSLNIILKDTDKDRLLRILFDYLSDIDKFSKSINGIFFAKAGGGIYVKIASWNGYFEELESLELTEQAVGLLSQTTPMLMTSFPNLFSNVLPKGINVNDLVEEAKKVENLKVYFRTGISKASEIEKQQEDESAPDEVEKQPESVSKPDEVEQQPKSESTPKDEIKKSSYSPDDSKGKSLSVTPKDSDLELIEIKNRLRKLTESLNSLKSEDFSKSADFKKLISRIESLERDTQQLKRFKRNILIVISIITMAVVVSFFRIF